MSGDLKHKTIFVTGGTGFIGSYLLRMLVDRGYQNIRALKRASSPMDLVGDVADRIEWVDGDLLDFDSMNAALEGVDRVFHCAAVVSFDARDQQLLRKVNIDGTALLVDLALDKEVEKLVHLSSVAAIGRRKNLGEITEDTAWERSKMNSAYGISKYQAEMEVWRAYAEGLPMAIVNPSLVIGSGFWQSGTPQIFAKIDEGLPFYPPGGNGYVDVRDVADFMIQLMESDIEGERYILSAENLSFREYFTAVAEALHRKPPAIKANRLMTELYWRWEVLKSRLLGQASVVTRETAQNSLNTWNFNNEKSKAALDFSYRPIQETVREIGRQYRESMQTDQGARALPLT